MKQQYLIIDFDSTFVQTESLQDLAEIALSSHPAKEELLDVIQKLTNKAMEGTMSFAESLEKRIALLSATTEHVDQTIAILRENISLSFLNNKQFLKTFGKNIYIVSGGFKEMILPIAVPLGIPGKNIFANTFKFDDKGRIIGIDTQNPLSHSGGKVAIVKALKLKGEIAIIGDGFTDLEIKQQIIHGKFFAFTENIRREKVVKYADKIVKNFDEVISEIT